MLNTYYTYIICGVSSLCYLILQIKQFKLEVALFARELNSYIENVNEIDDEATQLLVKTIISVNKLQINSNFRDASCVVESGFVNNLNGDVFECRRYIVCRLCSVKLLYFLFLEINFRITKTKLIFQEQIPLNTEDFNNHIQKRNHKDKEGSLKLRSQNDQVDHLVSTAPLFPKNDVNSVSAYERSNIKASSNNAVVHNEYGCTNSFRGSSIESSSNGSSHRSIDECPINSSHLRPEATLPQANFMPFITKNPVCEPFKTLKDAITNMECTSGVSKTRVHLNPEAIQELLNFSNGKTTSQAVPLTAISLTCRMIRRPFDEIEITALLMQYLNMFEPNLKVVPFGSATYGFGGSTTNFNILVNSGKQVFVRLN